MMPALLAPPRPTLAELATRYGPLPSRRFRLHPYPATEADVLNLHHTERKLYELANGLLVEKDMAFQESVLAMELGYHLKAYLKLQQPKPGVVTGADGMMRLAPGLVRIPDVAFVAREQFTTGRVEATAIPDLHPDLAIEVLSSSNTVEEMDEKLHDYFAAGTQLVWLVEPDDRSVSVFTTPDRSTATRLTLGDTLSGEPVLPGFTLPLAQLFAELDPL